MTPKEPRFARGRLLRELARKLKGRVAAAYVFGSYARGDADGDSDVDLLIIADTKLPWPDRARPYLDLVRQYAPVDILVYTPSEWTRVCRTPFLRRIRREMVAAIPLLEDEGAPAVNARARAIGRRATPRRSGRRLAVYPTSWR
jgi:predicted nucleotidyltransferase